MAPRDGPRTSQFIKPSPAKHVLQWLKKAVGLGSERDHPRRSQRKSKHRFRGSSFVLPTESPEIEPEPKPFFHTAGPHATAQAASSNEPYVPPPNVLIVGAGLSGLLLAQGLKKHGISFTVFDNDGSFHDATHGYHVPIDTTGYDALKAMLPDETFDLFLESVGQAFPEVVDLEAATGECLTRLTRSTTKQVFSVDRTVLRTILLHGLERGTELQRHRVFKKFRVLPNKTVEVQFTNGLFVRGTVLVGADGSASRVRAQVVRRPAVDALNTDCCVLYGQTRVTPALVTGGLASATTTTLVTSANPKIALRIEPLHVTPPSGVLSPPDQDECFVSWRLLARTETFLGHQLITVHELASFAPAQLAAVARCVTAAWHPLARAVVAAAADASCRFERLETTPPQVPWWKTSGVTLIGDAAHALADDNAALALHDATVLCERVVRMGVGVPAIAMYEKCMRLAVQDAVVENVHAHRALIGMPPIECMAPMRPPYS